MEVMFGVFNFSQLLLSMIAKRPNICCLYDSTQNVKVVGRPSLL